MYRRERGDGEIQTIVVIAMLLLVYITFPGTVKGFLAWSMQGVYDVFDAGKAPIEQPAETPPKPQKKTLPQTPADPATSEDKTEDAEKNTSSKQNHPAEQ